MMKERKFDLQERLIDYAVRIIKMSEKLPNTKIGNHIRAQILRSGTSPAPNYLKALIQRKRIIKLGYSTFRVHYWIFKMQKR